MIGMLIYVLVRLGASFETRSSTGETECDHRSSRGKANIVGDVEQGWPTPKIPSHRVEKEKTVGPDRIACKEIQAITSHTQSPYIWLYRSIDVGHRFIIRSSLDMIHTRLFRRHSIESHSGDRPAVSSQNCHEWLPLRTPNNRVRLVFKLLWRCGWVIRSPSGGHDRTPGQSADATQRHETKFGEGLSQACEGLALSRSCCLWRGC